MFALTARTLSGIRLKYLRYTNSKDKMNKIIRDNESETRLLSSAKSNNNPLAPGPRDVLCPKVIYSFVLQGTKALRTKYNLRLTGWTAGCEPLPHLKAPLTNSLKFASQLTKELRSDFFKLWAWHKEMLHRDVFVPVTVVAFRTAFSLLTTNWALVGLAVWGCTKRKATALLDEAFVQNVIPHCQANGRSIREIRYSFRLRPGELVTLSIKEKGCRLTGI